MRVVLSTVALALAALGCRAPAPDLPPRRTVASARRAGPAAARSGRTGGNTAANPPAVDSVRTCPESTFRTLSHYRANRSLHFGPLCTDVFNGRFGAIMATGTQNEATDVWVLFHDTRGDDVYRVRRWPVGARIEFGVIAQGWVYLLGHSNALEDMPSGARLLAIFPLPRPGAESAPEVRLLSPLEAPLLRASDANDLDRRLAFPVPERDPTTAQAEATVNAIAQQGPNQLLDHLLPEGAPTLRAWQIGIFQETDYVSPQGDPTSPHTANATSLIRLVARSMDCSAGDRCIERPELPLAPGATPAQVMLLYERQRVNIAALVSAAPPRTNGPEPSGSWSTERLDADEDVSLARALTLDGEPEGHVVGTTLGSARLVAFRVRRPRGTSETRAYLIDGDRAPRAYTDHSLPPSATGEIELHLRDYERDGGPELISIAHDSDNNPVTAVSSIAAPRTVAQQTLTHRLDMQRVAFTANTIADFDQRLRTFRAAPADPLVACGVLEHLAGLDSRAFAQATNNSLVTITYREPGQPLRGELQRISRRQLRRDGAARELLGPFAGLRCVDLRCDWHQSLCRLADDSREGVLWFSDGGRHIAAVSLFHP